MIVLDKKLRYLFDFAPRKTEYDDLFERKIRVDKTLFKARYYNKNIDETFDKEGGLLMPEVGRIADSVISKCLTPDDKKENWDLVHLDGNFDNCNLDNLEPVLFVDEDPTTRLYDMIESLKQQVLLQNEEIKKLSSEIVVKGYKVESANRQVLYEQKKNQELNKEIKSLEKEIRRLFDIIDAK